MFAQRQLEPFVEANAGYMLDLEHALTVLSVDHQAPILLLSRALSLSRSLALALARALSLSMSMCLTVLSSVSTIRRLILVY
jgi:hypothetical protein